jgi:hypothetical protein
MALKLSNKWHMEQGVERTDAGGMGYATVENKCMEDGGGTATGEAAQPDWLHRF